jgi:hypothetical protein
MRVSEHEDYLCPQYMEKHNKPTDISTTIDNVRARVASGTDYFDNAD